MRPLTFFEKFIIVIAAVFGYCTLLFRNWIEKRKYKKYVKKQLMVAKTRSNKESCYHNNKRAFVFVCFVVFVVGVCIIGATRNENPEPYKTITIGGFFTDNRGRYGVEDYNTGDQYFFRKPQVFLGVVSDHYSPKQLDMIKQIHKGDLIFINPDWLGVFSEAYDTNHKLIYTDK
jgi:hypothetical protein